MDIIIITNQKSLVFDPKGLFIMCILEMEEEYRKKQMKMKITDIIK